MRHLKIEILTSKGGGRYVRISEQTHRGWLFGGESKENPSKRVPPWLFAASNGFCLGSRISPDLLEFSDANGLFVQGSDISQDQIMVSVPGAAWEDRLKVAVREYNETYAAPNPGTIIYKEVIE